MPELSWYYGYPAVLLLMLVVVVVMLVLFGNDFAKFVPDNPMWLSGQFAPPPVFADPRKPRRESAAG